jgi:hypothetical protein
MMDLFWLWLQFDPAKFYGLNKLVDFNTFALGREEPPFGQVR